MERHGCRALRVEAFTALTCLQKAEYRCFGRQRQIPKRKVTQCALPDTTWLAVTQQGAAFAALVVGEGFYTRSQLEENMPGRPQLLPILAGTLGIIGALGLIKLGDPGTQLGLIVGGISSAILLALNIKRSIDTKGDPSEWPGPKSWPIFVSTGAFFSMLAFFQALSYLDGSTPS